MDCNNFFVSCERLFRPDLLKKPVAVLSSNDGCIVARSQEVKDLGVPMGVPYFQVKDVLEKGKVTLFSSNFILYRDISARVMESLQKEVGFIEVYSIDEAFFELEDSVTESEMLRIRNKIMKDVGIPISLGVAKTKTLAKHASHSAKKGNGVCILTDLLWKESLKVTPCGLVWGLGRQTVVKLRQMNVVTMGDFMEISLPMLRQHFGVMGERIQNELKGVIMYPLGEGRGTDVKQSITSTRSFEKTTTNLHDLESALAYHLTEVAKKLREKELLASHLSIMILPSRHGDFFMHRGSVEIVFPSPTQETRVLLTEGLTALKKIFENDVPYKKAGVVVSGLSPVAVRTNTLFETAEINTRTLDILTDKLNEKFGQGTVHSGAITKNGSRGSAKLRSKEYTTRWKDIPTVHTK